MTKKTVLKVIAALLILVLILGGAYEIIREKVPEGSVCLKYGNEKFYFQLDQMQLRPYSGTTQNLAHATKPVEGMGCELKEVLAFAGIDLDSVKGAKIVSSDNFSAEFGADEIREDGKVLLLLDKDGSVFSVVFNDIYYSKRKVKNVEFINAY